MFIFGTTGSDGEKDGGMLTQGTSTSGAKLRWGGPALTAEKVNMARIGESPLGDRAGVQKRVGGTFFRLVGC